jgi:ubiquinone/menaquinone biosynthesis C-methylase UbiE
MRNLRQFVPDFAGMKPGDSVLDVCCGTGAQVCQYAIRGMLATGIDLDPAMLKLAERYKKRLNLANASFQMADAAKLPFGDDTFDFASISLALHEKEDSLRDAVISEVRRVVKQGGSLVFIDFSSPVPGSLFGLAVRIVEPMAGREHHRYFRQYVAQGGLSRLLKKNGLEHVKQTCMKNGAISIMLVPNR